MKGFGQKTYQVETVRKDILRTGRMVTLARSGDRRFLEINSAAIAIDSSAETLKQWASNNKVEISQCHDGSTVLECIGIDGFVSFMNHMAHEADNPYALQIESQAVREGAMSAIAKAKAEGKDYIILPTGHRVRINEAGYFNAEDFAAALGMSGQELEQGINSEEFKAFQRNRW